MARDYLFGLISRLTYPEVRFFRRWVKKYAEEPDYLSLFEFYYRHKNLKSRQLALELGNDPGFPASKLSHQRYHLRRRLTEALSSREKVDEIEFANAGFAILLFRKGLVEEARSVLKKAKQKALGNEDFGFLIKLLDLEGTHGISDPVVLEAEENQAKEVYANWLEVKNLNRLLDFALSDKTSTSPKISLLKQIANNPLLKDSENALSYRAQFEYLTIKSRLASISGKRDLSLKLSEESLDLLASHKKCFPDFTRKYLKVIERRALLFAIDNKWVRFWEAMNNILAHPCKSIEEKASQFEFVSTRFFEVAISTGNEELGNLTIQYLESHFETYAPFLLDWKKQLLHYYKASFHFHSGNYSAAKKALIPIVVWEGADRRINTYEYSRLLEIILDFELGEISAMDANIASLSRHYKLNPTNLEFHSLLITTLRSLSRLKSGENGKVIEETLHRITELKGDPIQRWPFNFLDVSAWLQGKTSFSNGLEAIRDQWLAEFATQPSQSIPSEIKSKLQTA